MPKSYWWLLLGSFEKIWEYNRELFFNDIQYGERTETGNGNHPIPVLGWLGEELTGNPPDEERQEYVNAEHWQTERPSFARLVQVVRYPAECSYRASGDAFYEFFYRHAIDNWNICLKMPGQVDKTLWIGWNNITKKRRYARNREPGVKKIIGRLSICLFPFLTSEN